MRTVALLGLAAAVACSGTEANTQSPSQALSARATLAGNSPAWATSANMKAAAAAADWVNIRVYLAWQNADGARALAAAVSDPSSSSYGQYLTPQQFRAQFAPSQQAVQDVQQWLTSQGFDLIYTPLNNHYVAAEATVAQAAAAFGVTFNTYTVQGLALRAPSSDPTIPSKLAGVVSGVIGLDQTNQLVKLNIAHDPDATPSPGFLSPPPCSAYWGEKLATGFTNPYGSGVLPYLPCGYTPQQVKGAYGIGGTYDGRGQTVAIIDAYASPTIQQDLDSWSAARGIASTKITQVVAPGTYRHPEAGLKQDPQGWYGEETLDVEAVHGMAPGAHIVYVGAPNNFQDLDAAMNHVVDRGLAQIVSNSYGFTGELIPAGYITPLEHTLIQAAIQGIGVYFSSGDGGDETAVFGTAQTDWPASSPWVTAVGGTSIAVGASNNYLFETAWGTRRSIWSTVCPSPTNWPGPTGSIWCPAPPGPWLYGGGGGVSRIFAEPSYQVGVVPQSVFGAQGRTGRAVPDVSAIADPNTGYLVGQTQQFPNGTYYAEYRIGGTSVSCPIMAGIMALADQAKGAPHGFANPALYALSGSAAVNDIVNPESTVAAVRFDFRNGFDASQGSRFTLRTMNQTLTLKTTPGWDDATGIGTPAAGFISALAH
jgi:subtilase family serine protease